MWYRVVSFQCLCAGNWVHHICDQLRSLRSASEGGADLAEAWKTLFVPDTPPCPPGLLD